MKNKLFLTESEKSRISGLHRRAITNESKNILIEVDLIQLQQMLIDKNIMSPTLKSGQTSADGRLGPLTLNAIYSAITQTQPLVVSGETGIEKGETGKFLKFNLLPNMVGEGLYGDEAEGLKFTVVSVTPIDCKWMDTRIPPITEVLLKSTNPSAKYPNIYVYFLTGRAQGGPGGERKEIAFKKYNGGVKSNNPCELSGENSQNFAKLENFGTLTFK